MRRKWRKLQPGELVRIIVATVAVETETNDEGVTAFDVTRKLRSWSIDARKPTVAMYLSKLNKQGLVDRVSRGHYVVW